MLVQTTQSISTGTHAIVIGAGGSGGGFGQGTDGNNTTFHSETAIGGGGGGCYVPSNTGNIKEGRDGGSGGG